MIKLLYKKSLVQIKVNGRLTEPFRVECGVKQGCPLSAALYVLAINPLLKIINSDSRFTGYVLNDLYKLTALACADDVSVIIKNQKELLILKELLTKYDQASGAKLNQEKTEECGLDKTQENL